MFVSPVDFICMVAFDNL